MNTQPEGRACAKHSQHFPTAARQHACTDRQNSTKTPRSGHAWQSFWPSSAHCPTSSARPAISPPQLRLTKQQRLALSIKGLATFKHTTKPPHPSHRPDLDLLLADTAEKVPLHIKIVPHVGDVQIQILVEIAIQLMKFTKGELNPETITIKVNPQRKLYIAWFPQAVVNILTAITDPKPFTCTIPASRTIQYLPWTQEPVRYWMSLTQPESAPSIPTPILKMVLEDILTKNGLKIAELKPNLSKNTDVKNLTGVYYVAIHLKENFARDNPTVKSTLEELKHVVIKGAHWKTGLSHTLTHKLNLCTQCFCPLPEDHPAVVNKPVYLEHQTDEDTTVSHLRMTTYINTAMHTECRKKPAPKRAPASSNAIDTFKSMLAKRAKEEEAKELAEAPIATEKAA